jgi:hypothetical protein
MRSTDLSKLTNKQHARLNSARRRWYSSQPDVQATRRKRIVAAQNLVSLVARRPGVTQSKLEKEYGLPAIAIAHRNGRVVKTLQISNAQHKQGRRIRYYVPTAVPDGVEVIPYIPTERKPYVRTKPAPVRPRKNRIAVVNDGSGFKFRGAELADFYEAAKNDSEGESNG